MWIVLGEEKGLIKLVSKEGTDGLLPIGAFVTIEENETKFILQIVDTKQIESYSPSPLVVDMNIAPAVQDRRTQNVIMAKRIADDSKREDGLIDYIRPLSVARRSNQDEIDKALGNEEEGPEVMLATVFANQNNVLRDEQGKPITAKLPRDMFFHQIMICGKTGSGKTVGSKYLAQWFLETSVNGKPEGAVLAVNVKDVDFLQMERKSVVKNEQARKEWQQLNIEATGIENTTIHYPASVDVKTFKDVNTDYCKSVCLSAKDIDPEAMTGLIQGISDTAAQQLPGIFRWWQSKYGRTIENKFIDFVRYFQDGANDDRFFETQNALGENTGRIQLHAATYHNIVRCITKAEEFFDREGAEVISAEDILEPGKLSVINVACSNGITFGATLLRQLLHQIVDEKSQQRSDVPILIIIDEVHQFYNESSSREALGDLDTICRTGRSQEIGVIFSSQNPQDIPKGLSSVINTKIVFKSDVNAAKQLGSSFNSTDIEGMRKGFAAVSVNNMSQLKYVKFPISKAGVFEK